jgi:hypothetical protein
MPPSTIFENSGPGLKHAKKNCLKCNMILDVVRGCRDRMVVGFQQYCSYIVVVSFIGGGDWSTQRKPLT